MTQSDIDKTYFYQNGIKRGNIKIYIIIKLRNIYNIILQTNKNVILITSETPFFNYYTLLNLLSTPIKNSN